MVPSWLLWLVLTGLTVTSWECGVTPEWEYELNSKNKEARRLQPSRVFNRSETLGPLRILPYYLDMSAFSPSRLARIQNLIMPSVLSWFGNVLSVYNLRENWILPLETCGNAEVPIKHQTEGIPDVDIVIYVFAQSDPRGTQLATAGPCALEAGDSRGSPIAGTFQYNSFQYTDNVTVESEISTARHEITHVLGYLSILFPLYRQPDGSLYQDPVINATLRDTNVSMLATPTVVTKARSAFGCADLQGLELESLGGQGTAGSHPAKRIMFNDYMTGRVGAEPIYSDVTLAALDDSGWYKVNYDYTDQVKFGRGKGCSFFTDKCVVDGVAQFQEFCDTEDVRMCDLYHAEKAACDISNDISDIPSPFQYFLKPTTGGIDSLTDYCPYPQPYSNGDCKGRGAFPTSTDSKDSYGEKVCDTCMCFTGTYVKVESELKTHDHNGCHDVSCANGVATVTLGSIEVKCPVTGGQVSNILDYNGYLDCPSYETLCGLQVCINGCFGYGKCMNGTCICDDGYFGIDCSLLCDRRCIQCYGPLPTQCLSCNAGAEFIDINSTRACECVDGYVLSMTGACMKCRSNYGPSITVCGIALFGFIMSYLFLVIDGPSQDSPTTLATIELMFIKTEPSADVATQDVSVSTPGKLGISLEDFLASHLFFGLFNPTRGLERWLKSLFMTSSLLCELSIIGVLYFQNQIQKREAGIAAEVWANYSSTDFTYALLALIAGLGVSSLLLMTVGTDIKSAKRTMVIPGLVLGGVLSALAIGGTVYVNLGLCYESSGLWTVGTLPLVFGEVLICQVLLSLGRNFLLKLRN